MKAALITGSCGLVGSESVDFLHKKKFRVLGVDNNLRKHFFGKDGDTSWIKKNLISKNKNYKHFNTDIRSYSKMKLIFKKYNKINSSKYHFSSILFRIIFATSSE